MLILLSLIVSGSASKLDPFIVGGQTAPIEKWPFITFVEVIQLGGRVSVCGGSLLSSQTVLTAAHCLDDITKKKKLMFATTFTIYMGHSRFEEATMIRKVLDFETHKYYSPVDENVRYDIGVMFLATPVEFSHYVEKVILQRTFDIRKDTALAVAGWGLTSPEGAVSKRLKSVDLKPATYPSCDRLYKVICTEINDQDYAFSGDSGGPMVNAYTQHQIGIVSFRDESASITMFTSVPLYWNWINKTQLKLFRKYCGK